MWKSHLAAPCFILSALGDEFGLTLNHPGNPCYDSSAWSWMWLAFHFTWGDWKEAEEQLNKQKKFCGKKSVLRARLKNWYLEKRITNSKFLFWLVLSALMLWRNSWAQRHNGCLFWVSVRTWTTSHKQSCTALPMLVQDPALRLVKSFQWDDLQLL